jgi:Ca2+/H+ antiporter, TMEM165/GDT1 family
LDNHVLKTTEPAPISASSPASNGILAPFSRQSWFKEFFATFLTIFVAELGDKTQFATLMITAQSHSPWLVFTGAACALIMTSLVGILVGRWLSQRLSPETLKTMTGVSLLSIAVLLLWDVVRF